VNTSEILGQQLNLCNIFCTVHLHGHRLPSEEICNGYASDTCFAKAKPFRLKRLKKKKPDFEILTGIFDSQKKLSEKKSQNLALKCQTGNPACDQRLHETTTVR